MILGSLIKVSILLVKNVIRPLAKIVLIPLELTAAAPAAGEGIHKTILGSGTTTFIHSHIHSYIKRNNKSRTKCLMLPHPLSNFEIERYYQNESKFNCFYSKNNLPKIKNGS